MQFVEALFNNIMAVLTDPLALLFSFSINIILILLILRDHLKQKEERKRRFREENKELFNYVEKKYGSKRG